MSASEALRTVFADVGGGPGVFGTKAGDYAAARPDYPDALFAHVQERMGGAAPLQIADIGAGTGLFTQGWLVRGHAVIAVEPNDALRAGADATCGASPRYRSTAGHAEATGLAQDSIDLVTAAQAFHWFDAVRFRAECLRILRPRGQVALVWNERDDDPLNRALSALFDEFGSARRAVIAGGLIDEDSIARLFGRGRAQRWTTVHEQMLDAAGFTALAFSRSFMPPAQSPAGTAARQALGALFDAHAVGGWVRVAYHSVLFLGRPG